MLMRITNNLQLSEPDAHPLDVQPVVLCLREASAALTHVVQSVLALADTTVVEPCCQADYLIETVLRLVEPLANERGIRIVPYTMLLLTLPLPLHEAQHMLLHLVSNSMEAMPPNSAHEQTIWINIVAWDTIVVLTVRDTGPGVPEALRPYIFEPFVSTKGMDNNGMGLAIVRSMLQHAGGNIVLTDTRPGHTTFTAWLPRTLPDGSPVCV